MFKIIDRMTTVFLILLLVVFIFIYNTTIVSGESMKNSLNNRDLLLISLVEKNIERGDIVTVFSDNKPNGFIPSSINTIVQVYARKRILIVKRVIAMPNEEVELINENGVPKIIIYNKQNPQGVILDEPYANNSWVCTAGAANPMKSFERIKIPENNYFLMGDNRGCSYDSRFYGPFNQEAILGKVKTKINFGF